jgi:hypothetical protein
MWKYILGYVVIIGLNALYNYSFLQNVRMRYNSYLIIGGLPALTDLGLIGNETCVGPFECLQMQCETTLPLYSFNLTENCSMLRTNVTERFNSTILTFNILDVNRDIITFRVVYGMILFCVFAFILYRNARIPSWLLVLGIGSYVAIEIASSTMAVILLVLLKNVRPLYFPTFFVLDDDYSIRVEIAMMVLHCLVSVGIDFGIAWRISYFRARYIKTQPLHLQVDDGEMAFTKQVVVDYGASQNTDTYEYNNGLLSTNGQPAVMIRSLYAYFYSIYQENPDNEGILYLEITGRKEVEKLIDVLREHFNNSKYDVLCGAASVCVVLRLIPGDSRLILSYADDGITVETDIAQLDGYGLIQVFAEHGIVR